MEQHRTLISRRQGEHNHQCIVNSHFLMLARCDESSLTIVVRADEPACRYAPPMKFKDRFTCSRMSADNRLSLILLSHFLDIFRSITIFYV